MAFYTNSLNFPNLTTKTTPVGADLVLIADSAAGNALKQATAASIAVTNSQIIQNVQTGNYNVIASDNAKAILYKNANTVIFAPLVMLLAPATAGAGWYCYIVNQNLDFSGIITIAPASGTINAQASIALLPGHSCEVYSDGSNYYTSSLTPQLTVMFRGYAMATLPGLLSPTNSTTLTQTQGVLLNSNVVCVPFMFANNHGISSAYINAVVGLAASTVTVGIYADNGLNQQPANAAALGAASVSTATSGVKTITFGSKIQTYANTFYWAAIQASSAVTLSLTNNQMNVFSVPLLVGSLSFTGGINLPTLANAYSAGNLPTWSGTASSPQAYMPLIAFL